ADFNSRVSHRLKDPLSQAYQKLYREVGPIKRPPFDEGILEILKVSGAVPAHLVSNFRDTLGLRHWLAHGRYWKLKLGHHAYVPDDVYRTIDALLAAMPPTP